MKKRKVKRTKPMFKRRRSPVKVVLEIVLVVAILLGVAFLGYSVGKPILEFMRGRENVPAKTPESTPVTQDTLPTEPTSAEPPTTDEAVTEPEPVEEEGRRILYVSLPSGIGSGVDGYLSQYIGYAAENGYYGIELDLLAVGGKIYYSTQNEIAKFNSAVADGAIPDLSAVAKMISDAGLLPYARVSALSDHIASWDKTVCYLFENSTSTWLDESVANGGKPWMSAFAQGARDYMSSIVKEISDAGFAGVIAGEFEFPPFRNSDLNYVGQSVKSADRYKGLIEFSNILQDTVGSAKSYAIEVDAEDIIAGRAEILKDASALNCKTVYVRYSSAAVGTRIEKSDDSAVSYEGLSEQAKITAVFNSVRAALAPSGVTIIPAVDTEEDADFLESLGFDTSMTVVY